MTFAPLIRTQSDLERAWRALMQPLGWSRTSTWLMVIGPDGKPLPHLTEIEDCVGQPPPGAAQFLADLLDRLGEGVLPTGSRIAFLRSRPGRGGPDRDDRAWVRTLLVATRTARLPAEVVHLATDEQVLPVPMDDVGLTASA